MAKLTRDSVHKELLAASIGTRPNEAEMLLGMDLIQTHQIELVAACLQDEPGQTVVPPVTQRFAASVVAGLWPDRTDKERTRAEYWYHEYTLRYQAGFGSPSGDAAQIETLRQKIESDQRVKLVTPAV